MRRVLYAFMAAAFSTAISHAADKDPLQIIVSLEDQQLTVYQGQEVVTSSNISSGKEGHDTPTGIFSVLQKNRHHRSNIYSNAPMPFMQRLTWSGIALHASNSVPDYPASHGCVRMPHRFANELFRLDTRGAHVIIEEEVSKPIAVSHQSLFQPKKTWKPSNKNDAWVNEHIKNINLGFMSARRDLPVRVFITRRTHKDDLLEVQRLLNKLGFEAGDVDGLMGPQTWAAVTAFQREISMPEDGIITNSLIDTLYKKAKEERPLNGRILVRQHLQPIYEAQVTIRDPEQPLGSHLITVSGFDDTADKTDWIAVSLKDRVHSKIHLPSGVEINGTTKRRSVLEALDRLVLDAATREQISRFLTQGSSITISDNGLSIETGAKGTDFIVLTKPKNNDDLVAETADDKNSS